MPKYVLIQHGATETVADDDNRRGGMHIKNSCVTPLGVACFCSAACFCVTLVIKGSAEGGVEDDNVLFFCCKVVVGEVGLCVDN